MAKKGEKPKAKEAAENPEKNKENTQKPAKASPDPTPMATPDAKDFKNQWRPKRKRIF